MGQVRTLRAAAALALLALVGCPDDDEVIEPDPTPHPGADPAIRAAPGEARAGVIRPGADSAPALIDGIGAEGRPGDIKLWNDRVQFIVQGAYRSHGWIDVGGTIIDADLVRPEGEPGYDMVDDIFLSFGAARLVEADAVEVIADGGFGGPAIVRATGRDVLWDFFDGALELEEPLLGDLGLQVVTEYFLPPDSWSMRVTTTFTNTSDVEASFHPSDGWMVSGEDTNLVFGGAGFTDDAPREFPWAGWTGRLGEGAFGMWRQGGPGSSPSVAQLLTIASVSMVGDGTRHTLAPGEELEQVRWFALAPDTATISRERRVREGELQFGVFGIVRDGEGERVDGARVHFVNDEGEVDGYAVTRDGGEWATQLPEGLWSIHAVARHPGERVVPHSAGRWPALGTAAQQARQGERLAGTVASTPPPFPTGYGADTTSVAIEGDDWKASQVVLDMASPGEVTFDVVDDAARGLPAVLDIRRVDGDARPEGVPPEVLEALGLPTSASRASWAWVAGPGHAIALPAGTYEVEAAHSFRHERDTAEFVVTEGGRETVSLTLAEVVPRDGWFSVDPHLHASPSMDGSLAMEERIVVCAATGVDVPVTTDHDRMADYRPVVAAMGLEPTMLAMPGVEVTPVVRGHFNLFPVVPDPGAVNFGALRWWDRYPDTDALHAAGRAGAPEGAILQLNHGRNALGMFDLAGWTPDRVSRPDKFSLDFDLMEIISTEDEDDWMRNRNDWFALLSQGEIRVPTGASDSHERGHACGAGRTDVAIAAGSTAELTIDGVRDALRGGEVVVASGITLRATLDGEGPGRTVAGTSADLAIEVSGPSWVRPDVVRIWKDGEVLEEREIGEAIGGVWFSETVAVSADADAWFAVEVDGDTPLGHIWGGATPYALTNAYFLDVP